MESSYTLRGLEIGALLRQSTSLGVDSEIRNIGWNEVNIDLPALCVLCMSKISHRVNTCQTK